ncbi:MAG TPA: hypothetical protein VIH08_12290 [Blastococcus sp.]
MPVPGRLLAAALAGRGPVVLGEHTGRADRVAVQLVVPEVAAFALAAARLRMREPRAAAALARARDVDVDAGPGPPVAPARCTIRPPRLALPTAPPDRHRLTGTGPAHTGGRAPPRERMPRAALPAR